MNKILSITSFIWLPVFLYAQSPGLVIQTGLTASYSKDANITKANQGHYGWMVGADARILEGDLYFLIGGQFHKTDLMSTSSPDFFKNDWSMVMGRAGFGFNLLHLSERIVFRSKILGSINFILDAPENGQNIPGYIELNDSYFGAVTGLGLTIGSFDLDLDFQYGFINAYFEQPKSTFDSWTLMVGFHF
jgi:hypothetical protein